MTIYLDDERGFFEKNPEIYNKVEQVINKALDTEEVPYEVEVSLSVVNKDEIHEINKEHREIDRPTDVLSFPQIEPEKIGYINWDGMDFTDCTNYDTEEVILGDIILCEDIAREQAESYGHSLEREVCFLVAHSMLHLLGYDHMTDEDEKQMFSKQESILESLGIIR